MEKLREILRKAKPNLRPEKSKLPKVRDFIRQINSLLSQAGLQAECVAGGSYAKGTILKNDFDVDLFVRFDPRYRDKPISQMLEKALEPLEPELVHGSRDYFQVRRYDVTFEIIPVLKIGRYTEAQNVTDMSPLHVDYALKHFKKGMQDEVRLAKQFCKAIGVYGAESHIRGFSGHVLDLLTINYGSFENLIMHASIWGERVVIDTEGHHAAPLDVLNKAKLTSPMVLVDPLQPDRNAAAALSNEKFEGFKSAARALIRSPSEEFFRIKGLNPSDLKDKWKGEELTVLCAEPLKGKKDVVGTKMLKCFEYIKRKLVENEFILLDSGWEFKNPTLMYFAIKKERLSDTVVLEGPPTVQRENAMRFTLKHEKVSEKHGRLYAEEKRPYTTPSQLIDALLKEKHVQEKVKSIDRV